MSYNTCSYHKLNISTQAKLVAKQLICDYDMVDTGQIAFWLDVAVKSDFVALAVFIDKSMQAVDISCADDVIPLLKKVLPKNFFGVGC